MLGVVPILVTGDQAGVNTPLYLSLNIISLLFRSWSGPPTYLVTHELVFQLVVHLDQPVTGSRRE